MDKSRFEAMDLDIGIGMPFLDLGFVDGVLATDRAICERVGGRSDFNDSGYSSGAVVGHCGRYNDGLVRIFYKDCGFKDLNLYVRAHEEGHASDLLEIAEEVVIPAIKTVLELPYEPIWGELLAELSGIYSMVKMGATPIDAIKRLISQGFLNKDSLGVFKYRDQIF